MKTKQLILNGIEYFFNKKKIPEFTFENNQLAFVNSDLVHKVGGSIDNKIHSQHGHDWIEIR